MFKKKCRESQFPIGANEDYTDESNAFLKTISAEKDEDSISDFKCDNTQYFCCVPFSDFKFWFYFG